MTEHFSLEKSKSYSVGKRPVDPPFLHARVDDYYVRRLRDEWHGRHPVRGRLPGPDAIRLCTNDYLCLAGDPRIVEAEIAVLRESGHGESISRVFANHHIDRLREFELRIAGMTGAEDAVLWPSGYAANVGLVQALARPDMPIYLDMKAHMSLWEGVVSARAVGKPFRHNDPEHLDKLVAKHGPGLVIVDAVYSTDGKMACLPDFARIVRYHGCVLIVDETHSFGCQGANGAGLVCALGLEEFVHFRTFGMSKAVASRGGVVVCSKRNAEFIRYEAYPLMFSTTVLPHEVAGFSAALDIFEREPWRRERLHANHAYLRQRLDELGYNVDACDAHIVSLATGELEFLMLVRDVLEENGVFGAPFLPPATAPKSTLMRLSLNCDLTRDQLDVVVDICRDMRKHVRLAEWRSSRRRVSRGAQAVNASHESASQAAASAAS